MKLAFAYRLALAFAAVALITVFGTDDVLAQGVGPGTRSSEPFLAEGQSKIEEVYTAVRNVIWYVGGFGLIVLGIMAFFGKFKWAHFLALAGGLFLIGVTDQLIRYMGV